MEKFLTDFFCGARSQGSILCKLSIAEHPERSFGPTAGLHNTSTKNYVELCIARTNVRHPKTILKIF